jgi:hypothetical protein
MRRLGSELTTPVFETRMVQTVLGMLNAFAHSKVKVAL